MITSNEMSRILRYLTRTGLPLDLQVEVRDHMVEQIETLMEEEDMDFGDAFSHVLKNWEKDLKPIFSVYLMSRVPLLQKRISSGFASVVIQKSLLIFAPIFSISILLLLFSKTYAYYFFIGTFLSVVGVNSYFLVRNFKIFAKMSPFSEKGISYLQKGARNVNSFLVLVFLIILPDFNEKFERLYTSFFSLLHFDFSFISFFGFFVFYFVLFTGILGTFYFLQFKNAIHFLQRKINYKI